MDSTPEHGFNPDMAPDPRRLLPIVVGAGPRSELVDRPLAMRILNAIHERADSDLAGTNLCPLVLTDLWYLNDRELMLQPTIAIGDPEQNAASALFASRVPVALVVEDRYRVLLDQDGGIGHACMWGTSHEATRTAVDTFCDRHLTSYLQHAALRATSTQGP